MRKKKKKKKKRKVHRDHSEQVIPQYQNDDMLLSELKQAIETNASEANYASRQIKTAKQNSMFNLKQSP